MLIGPPWALIESGLNSELVVILIPSYTEVSLSGMENRWSGRKCRSENRWSGHKCRSENRWSGRKCRSAFILGGLNSGTLLCIILTVLVNLLYFATLCFHVAGNYLSLNDDCQ